MEKALEALHVWHDARSQRKRMRGPEYPVDAASRFTNLIAESQELTTHVFGPATPARRQSRRSGAAARAHHRPQLRLQLGPDRRGGRLAGDVVNLARVLLVIV